MRTYKKNIIFTYQYCKLFQVIIFSFQYIPMVTLWRFYKTNINIQLGLTIFLLIHKMNNH